MFTPNNNKSLASSFQLMIWSLGIQKVIRSKLVAGVNCDPEINQPPTTRWLLVSGSGEEGTKNVAVPKYSTLSLHVQV